MGELTTRTNSQAITHSQPSVLRHVESLSKTDHKGSYPSYPLTLRTEERNAVDEILNTIRKDFRPVTPADCSAAVSDLMVHFWDSKFTAEAVSRIQVDWYRVLQNHSGPTIDKAKIEWLKTQKKKPTPADILALCDAIDETPRQIVRLKKLRDIKIKDPKPEYVPDGIKVLGCPIKLGKMMKQAKSRGIDFSIEDQDKYLISGVDPEWVSNSMGVQ